MNESLENISIGSTTSEFNRRLKMIKIKEHEKRCKLYFQMALTIVIIFLCTFFIIYSTAYRKLNKEAELAILLTFEDLLVFIVGVWLGKVSSSSQVKAPILPVTRGDAHEL